nr:TetR family transcriptional regulator [Mediterraneibacter faecis]
MKKSFDKITIKMITDEAGVIRPTFYNYFRDKYEVMEWLLWEDVFKEVSKLMEQERGMESLKLLFRKFEEDKTYYEKVFEVTGQNSFEEMLYGRIFNMEEILVKNHPLKHVRGMPHVDEKIFLEFHAISLVNGLKYWLIKESKNISSGDAIEFYRYMMSHSILDLLDIEKTEKKK